MILINDKLLNTVSQSAKESNRLRMNYNLHNNLEDKVQRLVNALEIGTILPIHRHQHTDETYILLRGKIRVMFYNEMGANTHNFLLSPIDGSYGIHIPAGQWHTLKVLENNSVIFEVKEGPYAPLMEKDLLR